MPLTELNHYFVRSKDLERSRHFYCDILGFEEMSRPDFPFPGYWLGVNGKIQVHMGLDGIADSALYYFGTTAQSARNNSGIVDHIAFLATEPEKFLQRFDQVGLPSRHRYFGQMQLFQMFVTDPDGLTIELNFPDVAIEPVWAKSSASD